MEIVWVTRGFPYPPDAGDRIVIYNWISRLSNRGHDIHLLASVPEPPNDEEIEELSRHLSSVECYQNSLGVIGYLKSLSQPLTPFIIQLSKVPQLQQKINKLVDSRGINAVFIDHTHVSGYSVPEGVKTLLGVHNLEYKWYWNTIKLAFPKFESIGYAIETARMAMYEKNLFKKNAYTAYEFVSNAELRWVEDRYPDLSDQLEWAPIGVDIARFDKAEPAELTQTQPSIVFTGTMTSHLNTDAVKWFSEEIFPQIKNEVPNSQFIIVGKDPTEEVKQLSEIEDVIVTGGVSQVEPYLVGADLVVVPLRGGAGVKVKLLEGLATGNLVLTTDYGIQGTTVTPGEELLLANESQEFANLAIECLKEPEKFKSVRQKGKRYVQKNHAWESVIDRLENRLKDTNTEGLSER
ncbi:glycosyltransferase [Haloarcula brevis]|uniref:glycosyltransferase n=1 Tax=Haloarcula brevis TaxID=3111453 RepID=UPI00300F749B